MTMILRKSTSMASDFRLAFFIAVLACLVVGISGQNIEALINTTSYENLNAVVIAKGSNLKISIFVQMIWGEDADIYTMNEENYQKFIKSYLPADQPIHGKHKLNCNYSVGVNTSSEYKIEFVEDASTSRMQGFKAEDVEVGNGPIYITGGYRGVYCACETCARTGYISIKVTIADPLDPRIRNLIIVGAILVLMCGGLACCQFVYRQRQIERLETHRRVEEGEEMGMDNIALSEMPFSQPEITRI